MTVIPEWADAMALKPGQFTLPRITTANSWLESEVFTQTLLTD